MNLFTRAKLAVARVAIKVNNISFVPEWVRATFIQPLFLNLVAEGVRINSAVFACLTTLVWGFGEADMIVAASDGTEIPDHRLKKLLDRPNEDMTGRQLRQTILLYAAISGNGYLWIQRNNFGEAIALWPLNDSQVQVVPGRNSREGLVRYYMIADGGSVYDGTRINKEDIIHFKFMPDGANPELGLGGLQAAARDIDTDNEMGTYTFSLLRNNAIPPVVITMAEGEIVDEDVAMRLRQSWKERLGGSNRGLPAFLEAGMDVKTLGSELNEAAYAAMHALPESRIAATLRVPPILAGLKVGLDNSTYSNYAEARAAFTEDTLSPLWAAFAEVINMRLVGEDDGIHIIFNLDEIRSLQEDVDNLWTRIINAFNAGIITRAEAKTQLGEEVQEFDNVYKVQGATYFIEAGTDPLLGEFGGGVGSAAVGVAVAALTDGSEEKTVGSEGDTSAGENETKEFEKETTLFSFKIPATAADYLPPISFGRVVPAENLHMTVAIVDGKIDDTILDKIISKTFEKVPVVTVEFSGVGHFKESGAYYLTVTDDEGIRSFRRELVNQLLNNGVAVNLEHNFIPHVTISYTEKPPAEDFLFEPFVMNFDSLDISSDDGTNRKTFKIANSLEFQGEEKAARQTAAAFGRALQRTRFSTAGRMEAAIDHYFNALAERVVARAYEQGKSALTDFRLETKASADDLILPSDEKKLEELVRRFYVEMAMSTYGTVSTALGIQIDLDLKNPGLIEALNDASDRVVGITKTTKDKLNEALKKAADLGLNIDQIVRGTDDFPGIYGIVKETYKNRSKTIARTELGDAQNKVTIGLYEESGLVDQVMILDNGFKDSHETCVWIDGQIRPLAWTKSDHREGPSSDGVRNPLQHPNCVRTFAPYFGPKR